MGSLRDWFAEEMRLLGFAGLEGVFEYLSSMQDAEISPYLQSLLGSEPRIQAFASAYIKNRSAGAVGAKSATASSSTRPEEPLNFWEDVGSCATGQTKKSKRARGKQRASAAAGKRTTTQKHSTQTFASKVSRRPTPESEQAKAISSSAVEQARQKIREFRIARKPVNCIKCGKVEKLIREDGACSFCQAPIFSVWDGGGTASVREKVESFSAKSRRSSGSHERQPFPVVLGRYCLPSDMLTSDANVAITTITGAKNLERNGASAEIREREGSKSYYQNPLINLDELQRLSVANARNLKSSAVRNISQIGRLLIDDLSPSGFVHE